MPFASLGAHVEHPPPARQSFRLYDADLAGTPPAPHPSAATTANGRDLVSPDGDLYPFMCRTRPPRKPLPSGHLVLQCLHIRHDLRSLCTLPQVSKESLQEAIRNSQDLFGQAIAMETKKLYEFGPFRLDPDRFVLLRDSEPVSLPPKAFETLLVLVQHSDTVVLKDDLMKLVWPDTFVEESNLAQNIFVLRKALAQAAGDHRYILTVPGRGYRFTERVRLVPEAADIVVESHSITHVVVDEQTDDEQTDDDQTYKRSSSRWWPWVGVTAIALGVIFAAAGYRSSHKAPRLAEKDTVVIAEFANTTGDPVFDGALRQGLSAQLEQSPFLSLLSDRRIGETLSLMAQPKDARLNPEMAQEVCQRAAATAVLNGSIAQIGARYLLTLKALDCGTGELLASTSAEATDKNHVLEALGAVASGIRSKLGESLASVQKYDAPPQDVTTPSLDALRAYSLAIKSRNAPNADLALTTKLFQRAIDMDSNFAMAYAQMGVIYFNFGQGVKGSDSLRKAYQLRGRVSEREKLYIASHYDEQVLGDLEAARKDFQVWEQLYPRDPAPAANLNVVSLFLGNYQDVLDMTLKAERLGHPGSPLNSANTVWSYIFLNRLDEARATVLAAQSHNQDDVSFHLNLYIIDFLQHDFAGMKRELDGLVSNPTWGHVALNYEAATAGYDGQFSSARELTHRAVELAEKADNKEPAAAYCADGAIREALGGNAAWAKQQAKAALALSNGKDVEAMAAIALSMSGDSAQAKILSDGLARRFPQDTIVQLNYLPTIRAALQVRAHKADAAIQTLAPAEPYELGTSALDEGISLYPVYVRGEAYLAEKKGSAAVAEFQKIIDHPGVVQNELIGALAHLEQGRAYALLGETTRARTAYQDFFNLWKDADPDLRLLKQARIEYAMVQ
jgi:DNA-binding winged helix-turn-helix (wHTH) protein